MLHAIGALVGPRTSSQESTPEQAGRSVTTNTPKRTKRKGPGRAFIRSDYALLCSRTVPVTPHRNLRSQAAQNPQASRQRLSSPSRLLSMRACRVAVLVILLLSACGPGAEPSTTQEKESSRAPSFVEERPETISFSRAQSRAAFHFFLRNIGDREGSPSCWALLSSRTKPLPIRLSDAGVTADSRQEVVGRVTIPRGFRNDAVLEELEGFCG
jgi:hypothetical protein